MLTIRGTAGRLGVGGRQAAVLVGWKLVRDGGQARIEGTITVTNGFLLEHSSVFDLRLVLNQKIWLWRRIPIERVENEIVVTTSDSPEVQNA